MVNLLLEAVLRVGRQEHPNVGLYQADPRWQSKGWNEVHVAVAFDRTADLEVLLRKGKRETLDWRDKEGRTPFLLAATKGNIECAKILLESGADKNARSNDGRTALYRAVANGNCRMLEMLIEMDANPTISDDRGCSPLDIARDKDHAIKGHRDVVLALVEMGLDFERRNNEGHTALHLAVEGGDLEVVEALICKGADANAMTKTGVTPLYMAKIMGYDQISQLLRHTGICSSYTEYLRFQKQHTKVVT
ncbi:Ankyrin repeat family protein, putative isoform 2 [Hibiscus syriacus]|uniref:Ankyrin repeat family protein, putative isoform 2 n=1 Tax=Hibiscus syriacus TaxID=106335 RepID=A0A6A2XTL4_HIBSY|nr:Ankyrin repeat family protein, putative isoform 2 [Hibiscus syriacus]